MAFLKKKTKKISSNDQANIDVIKKKLDDTRNAYENLFCAAQGFGVSAIFAFFMCIAIFIGFLFAATGTPVLKESPLKPHPPNSAQYENKFLVEPINGVEHEKWGDDKLGYVGNRSDLKKEMKRFYDVTGVQPYLYTGNTLVDDTGKAYEGDTNLTQTKNLYKDIYGEDETHLLIVFLEDKNANNVNFYIYAGAEADKVINQPARAWMIDEAENLYVSQKFDKETYFPALIGSYADKFADATEKAILEADYENNKADYEKKMTEKAAQSRDDLADALAVSIFATCLLLVLTITFYFLARKREKEIGEYREMIEIFSIEIAGLDKADTEEEETLLKKYLKK